MFQQVQKVLYINRLFKVTTRGKKNVIGFSNYLTTAYIFNSDTQ